MDTIILILLIIAAVKSVVFGVVIYVCFRKDIVEWWSERRHPTKAAVPTCQYCQSVWTTPIGEPEARWEGEDLVLVTTYQCQHCRFPFWHVERVQTRRASGAPIRGNGLTKHRRP